MSAALLPEAPPPALSQPHPHLPTSGPQSAAHSNTLVLSQPRSGVSRPGPGGCPAAQPHIPSHCPAAGSVQPGRTPAALRGRLGAGEGGRSQLSAPIPSLLGLHPMERVSSHQAARHEHGTGTAHEMLLLPSPIQILRAGWAGRETQGAKGSLHPPRAGRGREKEPSRLSGRRREGARAGIKTFSEHWTFPAAWKQEAPRPENSNPHTPRIKAH